MGIVARKKCKNCLTCFTVFWVEGTRYYNCWLCQQTWQGRDDNLQLCEDPRIKINIPIEEREQDDNTNNANNIGN